MLIKTPKFWDKKNIISDILLPISYLYSFLNSVKAKLTNNYKSKKFIICVGNLNIGGAGKTPVSIAISKLIDLQSIFLSRGYGGSSKIARKVNEEDKAKLTGDEPLILSKYQDTYISKNKLEGIKIVENTDAEIIIMDDGLQNKSVYHGFKILVIDGNYGFGNGRIFPSGPLREKKCDYDAVVLIGEDKHNLSKDMHNIIYAKYKYIHDIDKSKRYLAFAGIARPSKFFDSLKELNIEIIHTLSYPDHYNYTNQDIEKLLDEACARNLLLITTEKDIVKIDKIYHKYIKILYIEIEFDEPERLKELIYEKIEIFNRSISSQNALHSN